MGEVFSSSRVRLEDGLGAIKISRSFSDAGRAFFRCSSFCSLTSISNRLVFISFKTFRYSVLTIGVVVLAYRGILERRSFGLSAIPLCNSQRLVVVL